MKRFTLTLAALLITTTAQAHDRNGYRDTGCNEAQSIPVMSKAGGVLYVMNHTCPPSEGQGTTPAGQPVTVTPTDPTTPTTPKQNSNASANNNKGGNYDQTGHTDNGQGRGRGRAQ